VSEDFEEFLRWHARRHARRRYCFDTIGWAVFIATLVIGVLLIWSRV